MSDVKAPGSGEDVPLKKLLTSAIADMQRLIKAQVELAKLEIAGSAQAAAKTGGLITGALVMAGTGGLFLLVTIAYVLVALGLPVWAGFAIVTGFLFLVAVILGLMGRSAAKKITPPERTIAEINKTKAALSGSSSPATGTLPASAGD
jgi:hypothetical protein